ncbi:transposase [Microseira wollei NIES-4236]|uniref:Transposase n=1 Tax=Microseira wollei NIES-4236 TaxID=2530354 RepID=A0AAV3XS41_9CYAN|nr:transposase [Microseira wollei NIES-4236]
MIDEWIELSRRQYNFRLGERFRWFDSTRTPVNACPLNVSIVPVEDIYRNIPLSKTLSKGKRKGEEYSLINQGYVDWPNVQKDDLTSTKRLFPEYKEMPSQVLQNVIERVTNAFDRFVKGDGNGKRSGKPKFKGKPYYRSICFPQGVEIVGTGQVDLPKIGVVSFMEHRPIPSGFTVKTATIVKELDGYSISFALDDESVPKEVVEIQPTEQNSKGIDLGLEFFASCSDGTQVEFPRWFRQLEEKMQGLQAKKARTPHGSIGRKILAVRIAWYQRSLARSRKDWQFKLAYKLFEDCQVIFIEDLALKNLIRRNQLKTNSDGKIMPNGQAAKSGLNKSMTDAALGQFVKILEWVAFKLGKRVLKVDPSGTSQYCHACLGQVPKSLKDRWHDCPHCLESLPRDVNSGKLIKWIGLNTVGMDSASLKNALNSAPTRAVTTKQEARVLSVLR